MCRQERPADRGLLPAMRGADQETKGGDRGGKLTMRVEIEVNAVVFEFVSLRHWEAKAQRWFRRAGLAASDVLCVDRRGRVCTTGRDFMRAEREAAYPITVYRVDLQSGEVTADGEF